MRKENELDTVQGYFEMNIDDCCNAIIYRTLIFQSAKVTAWLIILTGADKHDNDFNTEDLNRKLKEIFLFSHA